MKRTLDELYNSREFSFTPISAGSYHSAAVNDSGQVIMWGNNSFGQLGFSSRDNAINIPTIITELGSMIIRSVECGSYHTAIVTEYGELLLFGKNNHYQVTDKDISHISTPTPVKSTTKFLSVACGFAHTIALDVNQKLWVWGSNEQSQLGIDSDIKIQKTPIGLDNLPNIQFIAVGYFHSVIIDIDGNAWLWGDNEHGQLGCGRFDNNNPQQPKKINFSKKFKSISCGAYHTIAIDEDYYLWGWGWNSLGQIGIENRIDVSKPTRIATDEKMKQVSCGYSHSMAITEYGDVWSWGFNENYELGIGEIDSSSIPVKVNSVDNIQFICAGGSHSITLNHQGNLHAFGWNEEGQLGTGNWKDCSEPENVNFPVPTTIKNYCLIRGRATKSARFK